METRIHGRRVRCATGGRGLDGTEPAVVLVHGAGGDRTVWQLQTRWIAHHGYRAAALDLPGHGGSDGPSLPSIEQMGAWLADATEALGLAPAHLVGHSMGTFVALEAAAQRPDVARSLVLLGTASAMPVHPALQAAADRDDPVAGRLITSWGIGSRAHIGGHAAPGMWLIGGNTSLLDRAPEGVLGADLAACARIHRRGGCGSPDPMSGHSGAGPGGQDDPQPGFCVSHRGLRLRRGRGRAPRPGRSLPADRESYPGS